MNNNEMSALSNLIYVNLNNIMKEYIKNNYKMKSINKINKLMDILKILKE